MAGSHCIEEGGDRLEKGRKLQRRSKACTGASAIGGWLGYLGCSGEGRLGPALAAALLNELFEYPAGLVVTRQRRVEPLEAERLERAAGVCGPPPRRRAIGRPNSRPRAA